MNAIESEKLAQMHADARRDVFDRAFRGLMALKILGDDAKLVKKWVASGEIDHHVLNLALAQYEQSLVDCYRRQKKVGKVIKQDRR